MTASLRHWQIDALILAARKTTIWCGQFNSGDLKESIIEGNAFTYQTFLAAMNFIYTNAKSNVITERLDGHKTTKKILLKFGVSDTQSEWLVWAQYLTLNRPNWEWALYWSLGPTTSTELSLMKNTDNAIKTSNIIAACQFAERHRHVWS